MKFSEMTTRQAAACMAEIAVPVGNILKSETVKAWYEEHKQEQANLHAFLPLIPLLLRDHYDDTAAIIAAMSGKTKAELDSQLATQTIADLKGCMDQELFSFFTSQPKSEQEK